MKKLVLFFALVFAAQFSMAQDYNSAIGIRGGFSSGVTFKHFLDSDQAVEFLATSRRRGFKFTGLYERHEGPFEVDYLRLFYGAGVHASYFSASNFDFHPWFDRSGTYIVLGLDGIIGAEYTFKEFDLPLSVSLDIKPELNLIGYQGFAFDEIALSVRYTF